MKKILLTLVLAVTAIASYASDHHSRLMLGTGLLYPNTWDATVSYEYETRYHNAWEFFANGSLRWDDCEDCGHVCPKSFWHGYRTWGFGMAWKPCVIRGRNHHGNQNTYNLYSNAMCGSPLAEYVYDVLEYGQSAYIPSVSQMMLIHYAKAIVNPVIMRCGGDLLSDDPADTWYWTSTEVENQDAYKAWLFSVSSGATLETPKEESHKARPIFTIYNK